jgi:hypothetical protein
MWGALETWWAWHMSRAKNGGQHRPREKSEVRETLEGFLFRMARGDTSLGVDTVREVVSVLFSVVEDVEKAQEADQDVLFGMVQRLEVVERTLADLPNAKDLSTIHTLIFGNSDLGVLGLQVLVGEMQGAIRRLDRAVWVLLGMMGLLVALSLGMVVLWLIA